MSTAVDASDMHALLLNLYFSAVEGRQHFLIASQLRERMAGSELTLVLFSLVLALLLRGEYLIH